MAKASSWRRVFAGFYERIGSDGQTVVARVSRQDDGKWAYMVLPFGQALYGWQVTGQPTLAEAQRGAAAGYRRYMQEHREMNANR